MAIKVLKEGATRDEKDELMREALVTAQFDHEHVVMCIGVVTSGQPEMLVIQLCDKGALNDILKKAAAANEIIANDVSPASFACFCVRVRMLYFFVLALNTCITRCKGLGLAVHVPQVSLCESCLPFAVLSPRSK